MAAPITTIQNFRREVNAFLDAFENMKAIVAHCNMMGWTVSTWTAPLAGSDVSAAQFQAALDIVGPVDPTIVSARPTLEPMRP